MVLYQVISSYHLLNAMVHRVKYNDQAEAVLLIPNWICQKFPNYKELEKYFDKVIVFEAHLKVAKINEEYSVENLLYIEDLLNNNAIQLEAFEQIHVWGGHYIFGAYLVEKSIPFIFWEDGAGILTDKDVLLEIEKNNVIKREYCDNHGLYDGTCVNVQKRICNKDAQRDVCDSAEHFSVVRELMDLSEEKQKYIRSFFVKCESIDLEENTVLFLTQHFANLQVMSFEEQILIYQIVFDYFFENENVALKPHPDDVMYYGKLFPQYKVIRERFPSEFMPIIFNNRPKMIATISSTAINNLKNCFDDCVSFDTWYEKSFNMTHRYYVALKLLQKIFVDNKICTIGVNEQLIENFWRTKEWEKQQWYIELEANKCYLVDDIALQEKYTRETVIQLLEHLQEDAMVVFINSKQDFCFYDLYHKELWNSIVPVCIDKKKKRVEEFYENEEQEVIYVYSKNQEVLKMVKDFELNKELANVGMELEVKGLTPEEQRIKVLEGILEATEKRLLYYIQLHEEMDKERA